ncbi:hypothetical protein VNO77_04179 [Canavalia gladiata]|uniref:Uncharacterized protein n=1 Tax=Canavalia gladiata TaxID=3824 RepID=A0AAN9N1Q9_CANGL
MERLLIGSLSYSSLSSVTESLILVEIDRSSCKSEAYCHQIQRHSLRARSSTPGVCALACQGFFFLLSSG